MAMLAHKNKDNLNTQSMKEHSEHVALYSQCFLSSLGMKDSAYLIGLLHDLGKENKRFQDHLEDSPEKIDHAFVAAKYVYNRYPKGPNVFLYLLPLCVMSHHSYLMNLVNTLGESDFLTRIHKTEDYYDISVSNFLQDVINEKCLDDLFYRGSEEITTIVQGITKRYPKQKEFSLMFRFEIGLLMKLCYSALIDADCLDTSQFYQEVPFSIEETQHSPPWGTYYHQLMQYLQQFDNTSQINLMRNQISEACDAFGLREQGIYRLNVPTGGGKTLASLRFALKHATHHKNIKHIYYVIPFLSILDQTSKSIEDILFPDEKPKGWEFLQHYSNVIVDDEEEHLKYTQRWDSAIILTSMVRFMDTLFKGRKSDARRMHQLSNSVIIFDEIQSLPPKLMHMFNTAVNFLHHVCHSTILICTATQPHLHEMQRPLLLSKHPDVMINAEALYKDMKRVEVIDCCKPGGSSLEEIAQDALRYLAEHKQLMIVVNLKSKANDLYQLMSELCDSKTMLYHLSTSMCVAHRKDMLKEIREQLDQNMSLCLISTSLIEAGVDISFPCVIRALAGMDSIIQCAGRCNRHNELAKYNKKGQLFIYEIKGEVLDNLPHITHGKHCTIQLLNSYKKDPEIFDYDLTSLKAMEHYYKEYLNGIDVSEYDFKIPNCTKDDTLYDLLSRKSNSIEDDPMLGNFAFAFKDAGEKFNVIDQNTEDVIVPYENAQNDNRTRLSGRRIISLLLSETTSFEEKQGALREAQNYSVGLYPNDIQAIGSSGLQKLECGVWILDEKHYDKQRGVVKDGKCLGIFI